MNSKTAAVPQPRLQQAHQLSPDSSPLKRRTLFAGAGAVGALAATAAVLPLAQPAATAVAQAKTLDPAGGYQLTEHVERYYQTARV
jgi:hypothetical protein